MKGTVAPVQQLHRSQHLPLFNPDLLRDLRDDFLHVPWGVPRPVSNEGWELAIGMGPPWAGATLVLKSHLSELGPCIRLGASNWSYLGWAGMVWDEGPISEAVQVKNGLAAYAKHPLLRRVSTIRSTSR